MSKFIKPTKQELQYLSTGLAMVGIKANENAAEAILIVQDFLKTKGGDFDLHDAVEIQMYLEEKYKAEADPTKE